jgi:hypothetical protein
MREHLDGLGPLREKFELALAALLAAIAALLLSIFALVYSAWHG